MKLMIYLRIWYWRKAIEEFLTIVALFLGSEREMLSLIMMSIMIPMSL